MFHEKDIIWSPEVNYHLVTPLQASNMIKHNPETGDNIDINASMSVYPYEKVSLKHAGEFTVLKSVNNVPQETDQLQMQSTSTQYGAKRLERRTLLQCLDKINGPESTNHSKQSHDVSDLLIEFIQHFTDHKIVDYTSAQDFVAKFNLEGCAPTRASRFKLDRKDMHKNYRQIYQSFRLSYQIYFSFLEV